MTAYRDRLNAGHYAAPPTADELEDNTVADLKQQLSDKGLPVSGNKQDLIDRLANADNEPAAEPAE